MGFEDNAEIRTWETKLKKLLVLTGLCSFRSYLRELKPQMIAYSLTTTDVNCEQTNKQTANGSVFSVVELKPNHQLLVN